MKFRIVCLSVALALLAGLASLVGTNSVEAIPDHVVAQAPGECGYIPYMTLGSSCSGAGYIVGMSMPLPDCNATEIIYISLAINVHDCDLNDWTFQCKPAKYCTG